MTKTGLKHFNDSKAFIKYSNVWTIFIKILKNTTWIWNVKNIAVADIIADMLSNKKFNPIVTELFIRGWDLTFLFFLLHNLILLCQKILD